MSKAQNEPIGFVQFRRNLSEYFGYLAEGREVFVRAGYGSDANRTKATFKFARTRVVDEPAMYKQLSLTNRLNLRIEDVAPLKARSLQGLKELGIIYVGDMIQRQNEVLTCIEHFEREKLLKDVLEPLGIDWDTNVDEDYDSQRLDPSKDTPTMYMDKTRLRTTTATELMQMFQGAHNAKLVIKDGKGENVAAITVEQSLG